VQAAKLTIAWPNTMKSPALGIRGLLLSASTAFVASSGNLTTTVTPPMRAFDFYSKWGVNGTNDGPGLIQAGLQTLHMNRVRLPVYNDYSAAAALAQAGVKLHIMLQWYNTPPIPVSRWLQGLKDNVVTPHPGAVLTVSGPNELNLPWLASTFCYPDGDQCGIAAANAAQHDLYTGIHADPAFNRIKVNMWPLGFPYDPKYTSSVGDQTASCDQAEIHDYYAADDLNQFWGQATGSKAIDTYYGFARQVCNRPTVQTTEDGWCAPMVPSCQSSAPPQSVASEYVVARVALNTMIDHAKRLDNTGVYYFTLCCGDAWWSLLRDYRTPKPQGTAIANFLTIINDPGPDAAISQGGEMNYSLAGMPDKSEHFVIQKSDGTYDIILENHRSIWDATNHVQISVPTVPITVTFPCAMSGGVYDATKGTSPISTFSNVTSVQLGLGDAPLIVQVKCEAAL
jgi:hypothetical protein